MRRPYEHADSFMCERRGSSSFGMEGSNALARRIERALCFKGSDGARQTESLHLCLLPPPSPRTNWRDGNQPFLFSWTHPKHTAPAFFLPLLLSILFLLFIYLVDPAEKRKDLHFSQQSTKKSSRSARWAFLISAKHVIVRKQWQRSFLNELKKKEKKKTLQVRIYNPRWCCC